jgi:signal transduction histidine kinase
MESPFTPIILIVDDRPENLTAMEALLDGMEAVLVTARSGAEALRQTLRTAFALVLMDVRMPDMDGYETAELLRAHPRTRHLPIIFVTAGLGEDQQRFRGYEAGAVDYLVKPIEPAILRGKVQVFCDLARQRHQIEQQERHLEELVEQRTAALSATLGQLREANRLKEEFLATLAHELRNPLAPIRTGAYLLRQSDTLDREAREIVDLIDRQSAHMARLVDDLLDLARIERGKVSLRRERVEPAQVAAQALKVCAPLIQARNQRVDLALPPSLPAVDGDPVRLEQMLCNLLNNACKYSPEGSVIRVSAVVEEAGLVLSVRDPGQGMPPEVLGRVFDLFYQAGRGQAGPAGGLGIGLTLVRHLAELHGGSVQAFSEGPGRGSEFQLRLPVLAPPPGPPAAGPDAPAAAPASSGIHVLIIDDDPNVRLASELLLKAAGYQVSTAATGRRGLELALSRRPDVALVDLGMPGMDGREVAAQIRSALQDTIRLVALTGYSRASDVAESLAAGFDRHLVKSGDPHDLIAALRDLAPVRPLDAPGPEPAP